MHLLYFSFLQSLLLKYAKLLQTPVLLRHDIQIAAASLFDILRKKASATLTYKKLRVWYECNLCNMMPCCFGSCQTLKDAKCCYCVEIEIIFGSNKRISNIELSNILSIHYLLFDLPQSHVYSIYKFYQIQLLIWMNFIVWNVHSLQWVWM